MENEKQIPTQVNPTDPTSVTTQFVLREIASLKELLQRDIDSIDKAVVLAHEDLVRVPTDTQQQVGALKELMLAKLKGEHELKEEKFEKVYQRFDLIERQRIEQKQDTAEGVEKALSAAKEAVKEQNIANTLAITKSENYFTKQIDSLNDKINDLKDRFGKFEGIAIGALNQKTETRSSGSYVWTIVSIVAGIIMGLIGLYMGTMLSK